MALALGIGALVASVALGAACGSDDDADSSSTADATVVGSGVPTEGSYEIVSDAAVSRGGCLVESDIGVIDASVESRWRRAAASIGCDEAWIEAPAPEGAEDTTA